MTARLRIAGVIVTPIVMWDDGENLTPAEAQPIRCTLDDLAGLPDRLRADVEAVTSAPDDPGAARSA